MIYFLIFILSLIPRILYTNSLPASLNWDEVSLGYNAYSILKTGKDEWGISLPLIFRAYGDFKLPLYIYLSILPISILGLNPLSVRFVSIISGAIAPIFILLILTKLTKNKTVSFMAALLYSFSPWTIFLSRIALEANLFLTLFIISIYFLTTKKINLSLFFYSLCLFSYNSSRVILPFYLILIIYLSIKTKINIKKHLFPLSFFALSIIIFLLQSLDNSGQARFKWVSIIDEGAINQINQLRFTYPRIIANKATYFIFKSLQNYMSHFNPKFLFSSGGSHYQFNIPQFYLISPLLFPFFLSGFFQLIKKKYYLPLFILLISPIPSAITRDAPHTLRSIIFISIATLISIYGLITVFSKQIKWFMLLAILIIIVNQIQFWPKYKQYAKDYSSSWQYGYFQMIDIIKQNYHNYQNIYITKKYGEPHEFILFYWPWSPSDYQNDPNKIWNYHANWYWVDAFDKFVFLNDWDIKNYTFPSNSLLITSPGNYSNQAKIKETISYPNNQSVFDIVNYE